MAENTKKYDIPTEYEYKYKADYESDWAIHRNYIQNFDPWEAMLMGQVYDSVSNSIDGSKITDSYTTTLSKERADRVMAKLPEGEVEPTGKSDLGKAAFMDILRQKWIYPNANAQHSFFEKLNMWQFYSSVYGYMPMFYDLNISQSGYVGPDCWLWNPRNFVPQQGRASIASMDYATALTWVSKSYLEDMLADATGSEEETDEGDDQDKGLKENETAQGGWDIEALQLLIGLAEQSTNPDSLQDSKVTRERTPQSIKKGVCLATRYEAGQDGRWITFAPDHGCVQVRKLKNPHKNGRIPFVIKYCQPLFDSFYGLGDFQRAMPLQFARDGLTNFYFKGIKMNLIPPIIANANGVLKHTLDYREGAVMLETIPNSIRRLETSTAGLATFQAAQSNLTGSLLSLFGSQNASIPGADSLNPSQGKTPQAIDLYADKEATRDGSERRHLETAIQELTNGFFTIVANVCTEDVPVILFADDIKAIIKSGLTDIKGLFTKKNFKENENGTAAELTINPEALKGVEYRFKINPDSTAKANKQAILQALQDFIGAIGKLQNVWADDPTLTVHWDKIMGEYEELSGIPNASEFITFNPNAQAPPPPPPPPSVPSATSVQVGNGVHESADLVKLYLGTGDVTLQAQILKAMGFQPTQGEPAAEAAPENPAIGQPGANVTSTGHTFNDPHLAAAAEALQSQGQLPPAQPEKPAPEPTVASSGHAFNDATIGKAASAISAITPPPPAKPEPAKAATKK